MAPPVRRSSVIWVENALLLGAEEDTESLAIASDDDLLLPLSLRSSPDLPALEEDPVEYNIGGPPRRGSFSSLPNSSLPSSPAPEERCSSPEEESIPGQVYLYEKAGEGPHFFEIPSTDGFFCPINSFKFVNESPVISHDLKVYDAMMGGFIDLPPTAFWRQYSPDYFLIMKEGSIADSNCPGLHDLITRLGDPIDIMSVDEVCLGIWHQRRCQTPPCAQAPLPTLSPIQEKSLDDKAVQTIEGKKRKFEEIDVAVAGLLHKIMRYLDSVIDDSIDGGSSDDGDSDSDDGGDSDSGDEEDNDSEDEDDSDSDDEGSDDPMYLGSGESIDNPIIIF